MGYCYDNAGRLCCDVCGSTGSTRRYRCPFGWCQAVALCPRCRASHAHILTRAHHRKHGCEQRHSEFAGQMAQRQRMLSCGLYVRCSALSHNGEVKVIFQGARDSIAYLMAPETYHAIPLGVNAVPGDYQKHGAIRAAENADIYSAV